jgi:hypothetical protein
MFKTGFDDLFFTSHYINSLKEELMIAIQSQLPDSVTRASLLARNQQQGVKSKPSKAINVKFH